MFACVFGVGVRLGGGWRVTEVNDEINRMGGGHINDDHIGVRMRSSREGWGRDGMERMGEEGEVRLHQIHGNYANSSKHRITHTRTAYHTGMIIYI